jgi:hypothetical protein
MAKVKLEEEATTAPLTTTTKQETPLRMCTQRFRCTKCHGDIHLFTLRELKCVAPAQGGGVCNNNSAYMVRDAHLPIRYIC